MSPDELQQIESALGIALPAVYKQLISPFPVPYLNGNADTDLWDSARDLIERNQQLRHDRYQPWPEYWYFIGDPLTGSGNAIDIRDPIPAVVWLDHCSLSAKRMPATPLDQWVQRWQSSIFSDLIGDGIDPNSLPQPPSKQRSNWIVRLLGRATKKQ